MINYIHKYKAVLIVVVVFAAFFLGTVVQENHIDQDLQDIRDNAIEREYRNSLVGCERGNAVRTQLFMLATAGKLDNGGPLYNEVIKMIKSVPGANPSDGTIDCFEVVERPE